MLPITSVGTKDSDQQEDDMCKYVVTYAKVLLDKEQGVQLVGTFLGGVCDTPKDADQVARECVNTIKGGTIMPKILSMRGKGLLIDVMYTATDHFESMVVKMQEANSILARGARR